MSLAEVVGIRANVRVVRGKRPSAENWMMCSGIPCREAVDAAPMRNEWPEVLGCVGGGREQGKWESMLRFTVPERVDGE